MRFKFGFLSVLALAAATAFAQENYADWLYRKNLVINTTPTGANTSALVTNYPLLVRLTPAQSEIFHAAQASGQDLRFSKMDGTPLPYQIERWDNLNYNAEIWVRVDSVLANNATQAIQMYWGNDTATGESNSSAVFDTAAGYQAVFHFNEAPGVSPLDATINGFETGEESLTGYAFPSDTISGIGQAMYFPGASDGSAGSNLYIGSSASSKLNFAENGPYTLSAWVNLQGAPTAAQYRCIISKSDLQYNLLKSGNAPNTTADYEVNPYSTTDGNPNRWERAGGGTVSPGTWQYVVGMRYGDNAESLYVDGVAATAIINTNNGSNARDTTFDIRIGRRADSYSRYWSGMMDEVRFSNRTQSASSIKLDFATQRPGANSVQLGNTESRSLYFDEFFPGGDGDGDLGFVWNRTSSDQTGYLSVQTKNGAWAYEVTGVDESNPEAIFNLTLGVTGGDRPIPELNGDYSTVWSGGVQLDYMTGLLTQLEDASDHLHESNLNGLGLTTIDQDAGDTASVTPAAVTVSGTYLYTQVTDEGVTSYQTNDGSIGTLGPAELNLYDGGSGVIELSTDNPSYFEYGDGITLIEGGNVTTGSLEANVITADSIVCTPRWKIPDYVFEKGYQPTSLKDLEAYVRENKHLPEVPAAAQLQGGMNVGDMNLRLLKSVEELTLNVIDMNKQLQDEKARSASLEAGLRSLTQKEGK